MAAAARTHQPLAATSSLPGASAPTTPISHSSQRPPLTTGKSQSACDRPTSEQLGLFFHFIHQQHRLSIAAAPPSPRRSTGDLAEIETATCHVRPTPLLSSPLHRVQSSKIQQELPLLPSFSTDTDDTSSHPCTSSNRFDLYGPASPWGVSGIVYDPASPRPPWDYTNVISEATMHKVTISTPTWIQPYCPVLAPLSLSNAEDTGDIVEDSTIRNLRQIIFQLSKGAVCQSNMPADVLPPNMEGAIAVHPKPTSKNDAYTMTKRVISTGVTHRETESVEVTQGTPKRRRKLSSEASRPRVASPVMEGACPDITTHTATSETIQPHLIVARCCSSEVPSTLLKMLDGTSPTADPTLVEQYLNVVDRLCPRHMEKYLGARAANAFCAPTSWVAVPPSNTNAGAIPPPMKELSRRIAQLSENPQPRVRGPHLSQVPHVVQFPQYSHAIYSENSLSPWIADLKRKASSDLYSAPREFKTVKCSGERPLANRDRDNWYRESVLFEIQKKMRPLDPEKMTHGSLANETVFNLLSVAQHPNLSPEKGPVDAYLLTGDEARAMLDMGSPSVPVITEGEQMFQWKTGVRPIAELFRRMENLERQVSVQVPSRRCTVESFESRGLAEVRDRFLMADFPKQEAGAPNSDDVGGDGDSKEVPWNILDLGSPLPAAVLPRFLTGENSQLLMRLRDEVLSPDRAERGTATREQWNEWRDVLEWVLLSEGGHNTAPHTDSHGLGTWITVQEGRFGYGWLARPTLAERAAWTADPLDFTGGQWRYVVLEPGQTVFFNSGTVHFVFRMQQETTLALGGHVLQWTGIAGWLETVAEQMSNPHITNEDMEWSAPKYVRVVTRLVEQRKRQGRVEEMGGAVAVQQLLTMLKEFDERFAAVATPTPKRKTKRKSRR